jgi:hypothetical protein
MPHVVNVWREREIMDGLRLAAEGMGLAVDSVEIETRFGDLPPGIEAPRG